MEICHQIVKMRLGFFVALLVSVVVHLQLNLADHVGKFNYILRPHPLDCALVR